MTNYALTVSKRDGCKKDVGHKFNPELYTKYEGQDANGNWLATIWIRKDQTQAANSDTVTLTVS
jgi:hypothetical protein